MATNTDLKTEVDSLKSRVSTLAVSNSRLMDEVSTLKNNYTKLVEDMNSRLEVVHNKIFRQG